MDEKDREARWEAGFAELLAYKERFGHCRVPARWPENRRLGGWVDRMRGRYRKGLLPEDQRKRLEEAGFVWNIATWRWEQQFAALERYRERFGHSRVPGSWKEDPGLAIWVVNMRARKDRLSPEQVARMDALGFEWRIVTKEVIHASWEERFAQLEAFKAEHGHCRVTNSYKKNLPLATWVGNIRARKDRLSPQQVARLDALGFEWVVRRFLRTGSPAAARGKVALVRL
ncbi:MAG: helicase associated domain-containing protein [Coraliomargaritaceae bacterium]